MKSTLSFYLPVMNVFFSSNVRNESRFPGVSSQQKQVPVITSRLNKYTSYISLQTREHVRIDGEFWSCLHDVQGLWRVCRETCCIEEWDKAQHVIKINITKSPLVIFFILDSFFIIFFILDYLEKNTDFKCAVFSPET